MKVLKTALFAGAPFAAAMSAWLWFAGRPHGIVIGIAAGLVFGVAIALFAARMESKRAAVQAAELPGVVVRKAGTANHGPHGGWLFLTDTELVFKPHSMNVGAQRWRVPVASITSAEATRTAGVIPNGLVVTTSSGRERFVVSGNRAWAAAISAESKSV